MPQISVVIPCHNESGNIAALVAEVFEVIPADMLGEVSVVDDASIDVSATEVAALLLIHAKLRLLKNVKNVGQSASVRSGVKAARFALIATMDGDGQNPPADIPPAGGRLAGRWAASGGQAPDQAARYLVQTLGLQGRQRSAPGDAA